MKKLNLDFFKTAILIILLGFLFVFYQFSQNGRYIKDGLVIVDTHTGYLYIYTKNGLKPIDE